MKRDERHASRITLLRVIEEDRTPGRRLWRLIIRLADWLDRPQPTKETHNE